MAVYSAECGGTNRTVREPTGRSVRWSVCGASLLALLVLLASGISAGSALAAGDANRTECPATTEESPGFRSYPPRLSRLRAGEPSVQGWVRIPVRRIHRGRYVHPRLGPLAWSTVRPVRSVRSTSTISLVPPQVGRRRHCWPRRCRSSSSRIVSSRPWATKAPRLLCCAHPRSRYMRKIFISTDPLMVLFRWSVRCCRPPWCLLPPSSPGRGFGGHGYRIPVSRGDIGSQARAVRAASQRSTCHPVPLAICGPVIRPP